MLPRPTAEPTAARTKPMRLAHCSRGTCSMGASNLWVRLRAEPAGTTASLGYARSAPPTSAGSLTLAASLRAPPALATF
jgi:hypothetical protein